MFGICYLISRCLISRSMISQYLKCRYLVSLVTFGVMTRRYQQCRWVMTVRCHWPCCFELAKSITSLSFDSAAESMTLLSFDLAGRMVSLSLTYRCQWHCWLMPQPCLWRYELANNSANSPPFRKDFRTWISSLMKDVLWRKKNRVRKSRETVQLKLC
jgi:hypothetical protein